MTASFHILPRPSSPPLPPTLQYCYLDWALFCDPNSACCQQPEELFAANAPATCANRTSETGGDAVCDYEWDCLSRWGRLTMGGWLALWGGGRAKRPCKLQGLCRLPANLAFAFSCDKLLLRSARSSCSADPCNAFISAATCNLKTNCVWRAYGATSWSTPSQGKGGWGGLRGWGQRQPQERRTSP